MKIKKLLAWLLVLIMCFALVACRDTVVTSSDNSTVTSTESQIDNSTDTKKGSATPLLYRVIDNDGNVIWLFGSIHAGREDFYPLPDYILNAFDDADSLAVEADIIAFEKDLKQQTDALTHMVYTDGSSIKDHISDELYTKAVEILKEYNTYMSFLDMYRPVFWSNTIDSLHYEKIGANIELGVDKHLLERAYDTKKEILEVESVKLQYQILAGFSNELQTLLLQTSVDMYEDPDTARADLATLMDLWASGDEQAFSDYLADDTQEITVEEAPLYNEYNQAVIVDRNLSMADYAEEALKSGKEVFICVGAAHIVGEGAVAQLLEERGYTVECITQ